MRSAVAPAEQADTLSEAQRRFIDDLGQLYARYGIAVTFGRILGLLLLNDEPLSLADIAAQLEVSKSAVSVATRDLERVGVAHRRGAAGSRRVLYEANDDMVPTFQAQFERIRQSLPVYERARLLVKPGRARQRVSELIELHEFWLAQSEEIIDHWRRRTRRTGG
jgi:DNA-binding transcriptional regulator GbsR (MarR family)